AYTGDTDILFSPSGEVISRGLSTDKIILWVRDVSVDGTVQQGQGMSGIPNGDQSLVVVYARTGFIAAHAVYNGVNTVATSTPSNASPTGVQITVANASDIKPGDFLIIDGPGAAQETQQVYQVNGNSVIFYQMMFPHAPGCRVISDPYSYVRNAKSSGM